MKHSLFTLILLIFVRIANAQGGGVTYAEPNMKPRSLAKQIEQLQEQLALLCFPNERNFEQRSKQSISTEGWWGRNSSPTQKRDLMTRLHWSRVFAIWIQSTKATGGRETWRIDIQFSKMEKETLNEVTVSSISLMVEDPDFEILFADWLTTLRRDFSDAMTNTLKDWLDVELFNVADGVNKLVANDYVEDIPRDLADYLKRSGLRPTFCYQRKNIWHIKGDINRVGKSEMKLRVVLSNRKKLHDREYHCRLDPLEQYNRSVREIALHLEEKIKENRSKTPE